MENSKEIRMCDVYMRMEKELHVYEEACKEAENKINELLAKAEEAEAQMNKFRDEAEKVESENKVMFNNVAALKESLAALQKADFGPAEEDKKEEKQEPVKEIPVIAKVKPTKAWVRHKGEIGQFKADGTLINSFTSQKSAAISLRWNASSISKFMKLRRETQVRKKGFYLEYMG